MTIKDRRITQELVQDFDRYMKKNSSLYHDLAKVVKQYVPSQIKNQVIVDLGTGTGLLLPELHHVFPQAKLIGIDQSPEMITCAEQNIQAWNLHSLIKQGSAESIPLDDNYADCIVIRFSLYSWKDPVKAFEEITRVLKPGGYLVIEALNKQYPHWRRWFIQKKMARKQAKSTVIRFHIDSYKTAYSKTDVQQLLQTNGIKPVLVKGFFFGWKFVIIGEKQTV